MEKQCKKCKKIKPLDNFYKHKGMADGHVNTCKECKINYAKEYYIEKSKDENFLIKERERGKLKYAKYKYRSFKKYSTSKLKNTNRDLKIPKGKHAHHWSYNAEHFRDVFILDRKTHSRIHTKMVLDTDLLFFRDEKGNLLDTREKHYNYIKEVINKFNKEYNLNLIIPSE